MLESWILDDSWPEPWSLPCSSGSKRRQLPAGMVGTPQPAFLTLFASDGPEEEEEVADEREEEEKEDVFVFKDVNVAG